MSRPINRARDEVGGEVSCYELAIHVNVDSEDKYVETREVNGRERREERMGEGMKSKRNIVSYKALDTVHRVSPIQSCVPWGLSSNPLCRRCRLVS